MEKESVATGRLKKRGRNAAAGTHVGLEGAASPHEPMVRLDEKKNAAALEVRGA